MTNLGGPRFAIIGAGMSGILAGTKLGEAGFDYVVFEKADRLGGTWRDNTYPGIACDVPSHIYSYSFELNPDWSHFCSPGEEILEYFEGVADRHGVIDRIRFGDAVVSAEWLDGRWHLRTESGHEDTFDWVIAATGILHHPNLPDIEDIGSFEGPAFHSARWDHDVALDGRRIGVIGTGSSGVQITGALAARASHLSLFQRTAQWVLPVDQAAYSDEEREAFRTDADLLAGLHEELSHNFHDGFATAIIDADSGFSEGIEEQCRDYLESQVTDPALRRRLMPDYRAGCKRLVVSHNFYDAIQEPTAELVASPIECIEPGGIRTVDGRLHELDVLVYATGFHVDAFMRPMDVRGIDGVLLDDVWAERPTAYLSIAVPHFPNFFMLNGPNSPVGNFSLIMTAECQFQYVMKIVDLVEAGTLAFGEVTDAAADRFDAERVEAAQHTVWATGCRSWYLDDRGIPFAWPFPFARFRDEMAEPRLGDFVRPSA